MKRTSKLNKFEDLSGKRFGRLVCLNLAQPARYKGNTYWTCRCKCGTVKDIAARHLKDGSTTSCGCRREELYREINPIIARSLSNQQVRAIRRELDKGEPVAAIAASYGVCRNTIAYLKKGRFYSEVK